jgi:hypothetical protein
MSLSIEGMTGFPPSWEDSPQFLGQESYFGGNLALPASAGFVVVLGFGLFFSIFTTIVVFLNKPTMQQSPVNSLSEYCVPRTLETLSGCSSHTTLIPSPHHHAVVVVHLVDVDPDPVWWCFLRPCKEHRDICPLPPPVAHVSLATRKVTLSRKPHLFEFQDYEKVRTIVGISSTS